MAQDEVLGAILLSVKHEMLANQDYVRLILRLQTGTLHEVVPATCLSDQASPHRMAKVSPMAHFSRINQMQRSILIVLFYLLCCCG